ncbi:response regulator transcription factor [Saccharophagus degradans]|uniref:Response regulator transcription factor n=1 Tax=Saccharophagus degradans TaxID=86304 RepID=A0AAW7X8J0_9GAMM|nr:response regulator transcription factor [Saccharophagus degradans]MDO6423804.1 response regulator transcription factor [Saccharophagus degradans]MDO6607884.1 response regulator transcription factor [Saccharophagus degradans]
MINVLLAEDQSMVRGALAALLNMEENIRVVAQVEDGKAALEYLNRTHSETDAIDIVLTDIEMPNITGIELAEVLAEKFPELRTVIVTTFGRAGYIRRALAAGVYGFILKDAPSEILAEVLYKAMAGKKTIDPELAIAALDDKDPLSDKERKALRLAGSGKKTAEIADDLCLSEGTVRNYLSEAISKLNATNRIDAARIARQKGWL